MQKCPKKFTIVQIMLDSDYDNLHLNYKEQSKYDHSINFDVLFSFKINTKYGRYGGRQCVFLEADLFWIFLIFFKTS